MNKNILIKRVSEAMASSTLSKTVSSPQGKAIMEESVRVALNILKIYDTLEKYIVVSEHSLAQLKSTVNIKIDIGYMPIGGIVISSDGLTLYSQPMVLTVETK
jgi:hypothetical protein